VECKESVENLAISENSQIVRREIMEEKNSQAQNYWKANIRLIIILLAVWALVSYVFGIILAPALSNIYIGQLPVGFWFAQQGSMIVFVILIFVYGFTMDKIDQDHDMNE
jgi:putative solute:sodium symporter small subunit